MASPNGRISVPATLKDECHVHAFEFTRVPSGGWCRRKTTGIPVAARPLRPVQLNAATSLALKPLHY